MIDVELKILAFEYCLVKLIEKVENISIIQDLRYSKLKYLPFLLATSNGKENREDMFNNIFTRFNLDDDGYGIVDLDIDEKFNKNPSQTFTYFNVHEYGKEYILLRNNKEIGNTNIDVGNISGFTLKKRLDHAVDLLFKHQKNILKESTASILYLIQKQPSYVSLKWSSQNGNTNMDSYRKAAIKQQFLTETSYFTPVTES